MDSITWEELGKVVALGEYAAGEGMRGVSVMNLKKPAAGWPKGFPKVEVICEGEDGTFAAVDVQEVINWCVQTIKRVVVSVPTRKGWR